MKITVRFSPLTAQADSLGTYADALQRYAAEVEQIRGRLSSSMRTKSNISAALQAAAKNVDARAQAVSRMERGLQEILPVYRACETALAGGELTVGQTGSEEQSASEAAAEDGIISWSDLWKLTKTAGTAGGIIGGIGGIITGDDWVDSAKGIAGLVGTGAKAVDKISEGTYSLANVFGIDIVDPAEAVSKQLDGYVISGGKSAWSNVSAVAKWAGVALSGASNFMENVEEFGGDYSNLRMYQETVIETAADVALDVAATATVSAAMTAIGITAAPAVAVAAASVVVVWGANALCEWVTGGKDIAEVAADRVCDAVEALGDFGKGAIEAVGDAAKAIGNAVGDAAKAVSSGAKAAWKKITSWF